jgi:bacterioferritin (cytochrome b1)
MSKFVKEFIEIKEMATLDELIERLVALRGELPDSAETEVKMRGDDVFGRQLCVSYLRRQTSQEEECDARYASAYRMSRERELERLQQELGVVCRVPRQRRSLRIVA